MHVPLIHVKLGTTSHIWETLRIAIIVIVLASEVSRHVHEVEIQIATTSRTVMTVVNIHREGLADQVDLVEVVCVAVICGVSLHEVISIRRIVLDRCPIVYDRGTWQVVGVDHPVLIDLELPLIFGHKPAFRWTQVRLAVLEKISIIWVASGFLETPELNHGCIIWLCATIFTDALFCAGSDAGQEGHQSNKRWHCCSLSLRLCTSRFLQD